MRTATGHADAPEGITVRPVTNLPEIRTGDDLAALVAERVPDLADGDVVVVSSKVVSKAEGRVVTGLDRAAAVRAESVRVVARRGDTQIVQTRHGFVMAAAGVDGSNVGPDTVALLPQDPDRSARRLRRGLSDRLGVTVGVVVTDTFGRPWRLGQTDLAVGAAGVRVLESYAGLTDGYGATLAVTAPALADELAAAADLVKGKLARVPAAIVRGLADLVTAEDGDGVRQLVRPPENDLFRLGSREAMRAAVRMDAESPADAAGPVTAGPVAADDVTELLVDLVKAAPVTGCRFELVDDPAVVPDLPPDAVAADGGPVVVIRRAAASDRPSDPLAAGAAVERLRLALAVEGVATVLVPGGRPGTDAEPDLLGLLVVRMPPADPSTAAEGDVRSSGGHAAPAADRPGEPPPPPAR